LLRAVVCAREATLTHQPRSLSSGCALRGAQRDG
jgi:hypothetical protein